MTNTTQKGKIMKGKFVYIHLRDAVNDEGEVKGKELLGLTLQKCSMIASSFGLTKKTAMTK